MLFGGISGFNIIDPYKLKVNSYIPPVKITSLRLFNEELKPGRTSKPFLTNHIRATEQIKLKHNQNMLTFSFVSLNYVMPEKQISISSARIRRGMDRSRR
ncbi:MAG: hypothetical protein LIO65_04690 [Odoribacter sp.]|nr:hypothetical protein [Odoribacter sp.]